MSTYTILAPAECVFFSHVYIMFLVHLPNEQMHTTILNLE